MTSAQYVILNNSGTMYPPLVIRDVGDHTKHKTITNDIENVLHDLIVSGDLRPQQRLFYYGSEPIPVLTEVLHDRGAFVKFAPVDEDKSS